MRTFIVEVDVSDGSDIEEEQLKEQISVMLSESGVEVLSVDVNEED